MIISELEFSPQATLTLKNHIHDSINQVYRNWSDGFDPSYSCLEDSLNDIFEGDHEGQKLLEAANEATVMISGLIAVIAASEAKKKSIDEIDAYRIGLKALELYFIDKPKTEISLDATLGHLIMTFENLETRDYSISDENDKQPDPVSVQRQKALSLANPVRTAKALQIKKLKTYQLDPVDAVKSPELAIMKTEAFLLAIPGVGQVKSRKILKKTGISPEQKLNSLSNDQIISLLKNLPERSKPKEGNHGSAESRKQNLAKANEIRLYRANVMNDIKKRNVSIESALEDAKFGNLRVSKLVMSVPIGRNYFSVDRQKKLFSELHISQFVTCSKLTDRQKQVLIKRISEITY